MAVYPSACIGVGFEQEANAHLIAAAPDLLERLIESNRHLVGEFGLNHPLVKANRAAIAKALGEEHDQ
jgi:hypothetical protein